MMKDRSNGPRLNASAFLLILSAAAFIFSAAFSALAPGGTWNNVLFGVPMWTEADPAGYYIVSAHELYAFHGKHLYPGHPGLTLQILLHALQAAYYALRAPGDLGFTAFIAKNFTSVFILSKLLATGIHIMTFFLMYRFALSLLRRERAALLAALGYATSLPVVFYLSRVSVEPLMILFFLASFLCAWRSIEEAKSPRRTALWAAAAGALSIAGLVTKFHLLWPLPAACLGQLVFGDALPWKRAPARGRTPRALAFSAAALAALALSSLLMDWRDFFAYWDVGGMDHGTIGSGLAGLVAIQLDVLKAIVRGAAAMPASLWLPGPTRSGVYLLCELPMLLVAAAGAVRLFRGGGERAGRWFWLAAATAYTVLIWAYRCFGVSHDFHGFHYLFVFTALAAALFGAASDAIFERRRWTPAAEAAALVLWIALIHGLTLKGVFDSRLQDAVLYRRVRPFGAALARAIGRERVALIGIDPGTAVGLSGLAILRETPPMRSALLEELAGDYVKVDRAELEHLTTRPAAGERPVGSVVAIGVVDGVPSAVGPYPPDRWLAAFPR
jgi:hypothetical protein